MLNTRSTPINRGASLSRTMNHKKALLIYSGWLGDFVWIIPTVRALKEKFQSLSMVVSELQGTMAKRLKGNVLDQLFVDTKAQRQTMARTVRRTAREQEIGTFIDIKGRGKSGMYIPWQSGTRVYVPARKDAREYLLIKMLHPLSLPLPDRNCSRHMVDSYLEIADFFGDGSPAVSFDLPFDSRTVEEGEETAERESLKTGKTVALNLGSAQYSKIWPAENFLKLAEALESDLKCKVVIMGAKDYKPNNNYDVNASQKYFADGRFTNLVEETDFLVDSYLLKSGIFNVSVGNDSFAGHMAGSANEVPGNTEGALQADDGKYYRANRTVSLFGPTNPRFCRPYDPTGRFNMIVQPNEYPADCPYDRERHICPHYKDRTCVGGNHCMNGITVEQVIEAVEKQLTT